jgi:3-phosphoshikimate 1-carboxyvinyltransferase
MATELRKLGVLLEEYPDGIAITGPAVINGASVESYGDHRIAMALSVAGLISRSPITVNDASCADVSFPGFYEALRGLER